MNKRIKLGVISVISSGLIACGGSNNDDNTSSNQRYEIQIVNLTHNQPLSPAAIIAHANGYSAFNDAETASEAIEILAEGGDNSALITEAMATPEYVTHGATGLIGPKSSSAPITLEVPSNSSADLRLSIVSMLVNTNDAFTGLDEADISNLQMGEQISWNAPTWDAGTELNSEAADTIPGPADGGTGFDAQRDDIIDRVRLHQGVVTAADGLTTSVLNESHRFLNPSARVTVTRVE